MSRVSTGLTPAKCFDGVIVNTLSDQHCMSTQEPFPWLLIEYPAEAGRQDFPPVLFHLLKVPVFGFRFQTIKDGGVHSNKVEVRVGSQFPTTSQDHFVGRTHLSWYLFS